jgi:glycosyltransferase involved in cell wall biosynthesis
MVMSWEPTVCVIIPCYNVEQVVAKCIESILEQEYPADKLKIVAVDDGSTDQTYEILNEYKSDPRFKALQHQVNSGLAATRNTGLRASKSEVVGFIDSDIVVQKDWLRTLLVTLADEEIVGCMGDTRLPFELKPNRLDKFLYHPKRGARNKGPGVPIKFAWFLFNNTVVKRDALGLDGYFDESFKGYGGEDTDLSIKLWMRHKNGLRFNPEAMGDHYHQRNLMELRHVLRRFGSTNYLALLERYPELRRDLRGHWINSYTGYILFNPLTMLVATTIYHIFPFLKIIQFIITGTTLEGARSVTQKQTDERR